MGYTPKVADNDQRCVPSSWALLCQCGVRCHMEHMERVRRKLESAHAAALAAGRHPSIDFDPAKVWDGVWRAAVGDTDFWRRQFEEPALLLKVHISTPGSAISGEAPVGTDTATAPPKRVRPRPDAEHGEPPAKVHKVSDGHYTHNRRGRKLCGAFQTGQCPLGPQLLCPSGSVAAHQCSKCLFPTHGSTSPTACGGAPREPSAHPAKGKGRVRGTGKRKGMAQY